MPPHLALLDYVDNAVSPRHQMVGDYLSVASPVLLLGAHESGSPSLREAEQNPQSLSKLFGEGVVGVVPESSAPPSLVGRLLSEASPPVSSKALPQPNVSHAYASERFLKGVPVEVGAAPRGGPPPHVDEDLDVMLLEQLEELFQGSC